MQRCVPSTSTTCQGAREIVDATATRIIGRDRNRRYGTTLELQRAASDYSMVSSPASGLQLSSSIAIVVALLTGVLPQAVAKGPCTDYFGRDVDSNSTTGTLWTVADVDVHAGFPFGNETFIHHSGPHSACHSPGPPAGCQCEPYLLRNFSSACPRHL